MWMLVKLQWLTGIVLSFALMFVSVYHMFSALFGAIAVIIPSTVFAVRLHLGASSAAKKVAVFLVGEFLKILATLLILALTAVLYSGLVWWAMLLAVVVTIKSYFLTFILK